MLDVFFFLENVFINFKFIKDCFKLYKNFFVFIEGGLVCIFFSCYISSVGFILCLNFLWFIKMDICGVMRENKELEILEIE